MVIRTTILVLALVMLVGTVSAVDCTQEYQLLKLEYSNGDFRAIDKSIEKGCIPRERIGEYKIEVQKEGEKIYSYGFNPSVLYTDAGFGDTLVGGPEVVQERTFSVAVPIVKDASVKVYHGNKEVLSITEETTSEEQVRSEFSLFGWVKNAMDLALGALVP